MTECCSHGDVRLVGGSADYEGNVQVCIGDMSAINIIGIGMKLIM